MRVQFNKTYMLIGCLINLFFIGLVLYFLWPLIKYILIIGFTLIVGSMLAYVIYRFIEKNFTRLKATDEVIDFVFPILGYYATLTSEPKDLLIYKHIFDVIAELKLLDDQAARAKNLYSKGLNLSESEVKQLLKDHKKYWNNPFDRKKLFGWIAELFFCDNVITSNEQRHFNQLAQILGFSEERTQFLFNRYLRKFGYFYDQGSNSYRNSVNFNEFFSRFFEQMHNAQSGGSYSGGYDYTANREQDLASAYRILGIDENTSDAEAKKAYLRLMNRYHPDKAAARGMSEADVEKYKELTQKVQAAWQVVKQHRNL